MNNPFPKAPSGSYKSILVEGLRNIGEDKVADEFQKGNMRLAITSSITGNVKLFHELKEVCEKALNNVEVTDVVRYYFWGISNKQFVIASSNVDFIYDPTDNDSIEYVKKRVEADNEVVHPFFTT